MIYIYFFPSGNKIREAVSRDGRRNRHLSAPTWVKLGGLSRHGRGRVLQLVGRGGARAVHAVGGHVSPVGGGGIILGILVLAKRRVRGIILQRE